MSGLAAAATSPLFDRLCGVASLPAGGGLLDAAGLHRSIARELGLLLNTRSRCTVAAFLADKLTVLDYGVPDLSAMSARSITDLALVQSVVAKAIASFEPRLLHPQLEVAPQIGARDGVFLRITAAVLLGQTLRRVQFDTDVAAGGSSAR